jgi:hypothetical protein
MRTSFKEEMAALERDLSVLVARFLKIQDRLDDEDDAAPAPAEAREAPSSEAETLLTAYV